MRSLAITTAIFIVLVSGLSSYNYALLGFNWITFMRPQSLDAWGYWNEKPLFQIGLALLLLTGIRTQNFRFRFNYFTILFIIFYFWIITSAIFSVYPSISWQWFNTFYFTLGISLLLLSFLISSIHALKLCLISLSGSILVLAAKVGVSNTLHGGSRITEQIDGFVGDNNCFGLSICMALGIILGIRSIIKNKFLRSLADIGILFSILTILYTQSRGAFLTLAIIFTFGILSSKRPVINTLLIGVVVITGYFVLPKDMFSRLNTVENLQEDESAVGRFTMWERAFSYANKRPITGLGIGCFRPYNSHIAPPPHLVTHSVYFQVLSELGYVGLFLYLLIIFSSIIYLHIIYSKAIVASQIHDEIKWIASTTFWMRNALIGYIFGSAFLDMLVYDIPWYSMLYSSMFSLFYDDYVKELELNKFVTSVPVQPEPED